MDRAGRPRGNLREDYSPDGEERPLPDTVRDFGRSHDGLLCDFATRLTGSSDLYGGAGRRPPASVNLITAHDGFTLAEFRRRRLLVGADTQQLCWSPRPAPR